MTTHLRDAAAALGEALVRAIGEPRYKLWFDGKTRFRLDGDDLVVGVPNRHFEEWLGRTFRDVIAAAAAETFGRPLAVRFHIDAELFQAARREQEATPPNTEPFSRDAERSATAPALRSASRLN